MIQNWISRKSENNLFSKHLKSDYARPSESIMRYVEILQNLDMQFYKSIFSLFLDCYDQFARSIGQVRPPESIKIGLS